MPRLPHVSGESVVKLLTSLGYAEVRQRGSHIRLRRKTPTGEHNITVPRHDPIAKGTLSDIISRVSLWSGIPKEELTKRLRRA